jgi:1,4-alpha-glucan branching enzyme
MGHADREKIQEQERAFRQYETELNPANPTRSTLSERRIGILEERIGKLFTQVKSKLAPPLSPQQILEQQQNSLERFKDSLRAFTEGRLEPKKLWTQFKELPPAAQKKIDAIVCMACDRPNELQSSELLLKQNLGILQDRFRSLIGVKEGTLIEQVQEDLRIDFELTNKDGGNANHLIDQKVGFFRVCFSQMSNSRAHMKALFNFMHPLVQERLSAEGMGPLPGEKDLSFYGREIKPTLYQSLGCHYNRDTHCTTFRVYAPNASNVVLNLTAFGSVNYAINMTKSADGYWTAETADDKAAPGRTYHFMVTGKDSSQPVKKVDPFAFRNLIHGSRGMRIDLNEVSRAVHEESREEISVSKLWETVNKGESLDSKIRLEGVRGNQESVVFDIGADYAWTDQIWMDQRKTQPFDIAKQALTIYEVHSPSWKLGDGGKILNWRELAPDLAKYCKDNHYNAVELMAMFAHPQYISMGYQITSFFAPNSDMGTWTDFQYFVNHMHDQKIYVFADWVPGHFATDPFGLGKFDGTAIFEDDNDMYGYHPEWGTKIFDFKKQFTKDFLASNADFLLSKLHIDGLRVDGVSSMLCLNFGREKQIDRGEYVKRYNKKGQNEDDLDVKAFFRHLNTYLHKQYPGVSIMAEESAGFANLVRSPDKRGDYTRTRGLGFDAAWHMGFMNDTLKYWKLPAGDRPNAFHDLFTKTVKDVDVGNDVRPRGKCVIAYSHDESCNMKGSIFTKMLGWQNRENDLKFANGRLALAYQLLRGGGPTLDFMGNEILQTSEWHGIVWNNRLNPNQQVKPSFQWEELDPKDSNHHYHVGAQASRRDLNELYLKRHGLWDQTDEGFSWIRADKWEDCVLSFHRRGKIPNGDRKEQFACIFNTSHKDLTDYEIDLPGALYAPELDKLTAVWEAYNTDKLNYGGRGRTNATIEILRRDSTNPGRPTQFKLRLPPFTAIVLEEQFS